MTHFLQILHNLQFKIQLKIRANQMQRESCECKSNRASNRIIPRRLAKIFLPPKEGYVSITHHPSFVKGLAGNYPSKNEMKQSGLGSPLRIDHVLSVTLTAQKRRRFGCNTLFHSHSNSIATFQFHLALSLCKLVSWAQTAIISRNGQFWTAPAVMESLSIDSRSIKFIPVHYQVQLSGFTNVSLTVRPLSEKSASYIASTRPCSDSPKLDGKDHCQTSQTSEH